jgi:hypothetical protein
MVVDSVEFGYLAHHAGVVTAQLEAFFLGHSRVQRSDFGGDLCRVGGLVYIQGPHSHNSAAKFRLANARFTRRVRATSGALSGNLQAEHTGWLRRGLYRLTGAVLFLLTRKRIVG